MNMFWNAKVERALLMTTLVVSVFLFCIPQSAWAEKNHEKNQKKMRKAYTVEEVTEDVVVQRPTNPVMEVLIGSAIQENAAELDTTIDDSNEGEQVQYAPTRFTVEDAAVVENDLGRVLFVVEPETEIQIKWHPIQERYIVRYEGKRKRSKEAVRVTPVTMNARVTITNFEKRPAWNTELNDNYFFGSIELVYSENSAKTLLVNHIPLERYVSGIAEVSNSHPQAHLRALLTASRTYALYHILHPTKHAAEPYILDATEGDQVYRGAGFSDRSPRVVAAQRATKRKVIQYNNEPIIAPYSSRTDGRTRAWSEVWNGEYEWAQSVEDPCCVGSTPLGHGVGLSGEGSRYFAEQGWGWQKILTYYYTGVNITKGY